MEQTGMADRFDYELRALEADSQAETAHRVSIAHGWRDIARGYRMLADFIADARRQISVATITDTIHLTVRMSARPREAGARSHCATARDRWRRRTE
jgi:hypothetical protein